MDTIYKEWGAQVGMFGITSGNFTSPSEVLSKNAATGRGSFHLRQPNSIQYLSPEFGNIQLGVQYSPDENRNNIGADPINAQLWSFGVKYEAGPLYVSLQHEIHKDFFGGSDRTAFDGTNAHSKDYATRLSATYKMGPHTFAADISQINYTESDPTATPAFDEYKHVSFALGWEAKWGGPIRTGVEYVQSQAGTCKLTAGDCSTDGLKGQMIAAGVAYDLDKNTFLFLIGARLNNGNSAIFNNFNRDADVGRGADITQVAVGMQYKF
jgi:predicted porin